MMRATTRTSGRTRCCCSATRSTPTRSRPSVREFIRARARPRRARPARVADFGSTRGCTASRGRPAHALAALDGARRDDLRRPRRPRRLEHLDDVGRGDAREAWWDERIVGGFMSTGSTSTSATSSPGPRRRRALRAGAGGRGRRAGPARVRVRADREAAGTRWSYCRDFGRTRLVVIDSRAGRVLDPPDERSMSTRGVGAGSRSTPAGDFDHLLIGTSLPFLLAPGLHHLEAWNEAVCDGAWGALAARLGRADPPGRSTSSTGPRSRVVRPPRRIARRASAAGEHGRRRRRSSCCRATCTTPTSPRSRFPRGAGVRRAVYQATARRSATRSTRASGASIRFACSTRGHARRPAARARRRRPRPAGPLAHPLEGAVLRQPGRPLVLDGRRARLRLQKTVPDENEGFSLETVFERLA